MTKTQFATFTVLLVLITALLGALAYGAFVPQVSAECLAAIDAASSLPATGDILDEYNTAAYELAENINQQIFMTGEYQVLLLAIISEQQAALVNMTTACR